MFKLDDGDLRAWIEQEQSICIKAVDRHGDPVELSIEEAQKLADALIEMIREVRAAEGG